MYPGPGELRPGVLDTPENYRNEVLAMPPQELAARYGAFLGPEFHVTIALAQDTQTAVAHARAAQAAPPGHVPQVVLGYVPPVATLHVPAAGPRRSPTPPNMTR